MLSTALGRGTNPTMSEKSVCLTEVEVPSPITEEEWFAGLLITAYTSRLGHSLTDLIH